MNGTLVSALVCALLFAALASAADSPRMVWVKVKCAVCHGIDGHPTARGAKLKTPDLRTPEIQQLSDDELTAKVVAGQKRMPSFRKQLTEAQVRLLVTYIRGMGKPKA